jgi:hypothetical protein
LRLFQGPCEFLFRPLFGRPDIRQHDPKQFIDVVGVPSDQLVMVDVNSPCEFSGINSPCVPTDDVRDFVNPSAAEDPVGKFADAFGSPFDRSDPPLK